VAGAARAEGVETITVTGKNAEDFSLPGRVEKFLPPYGYPPSPFARACVALRRFGAYLALFRRHGAKHALFFVHSAPQNELPVMLFAWLCALRPGRLTLFLRHDIAETWAKSILIRLLSFAHGAGARYVSDSDSLIENLSPRLGCPIALLPIPALLPEHIKRDAGVTVCGYFGARRRQKGFALLPDLATAAKKQDAQTRFVFQAYRHREDKVDAELEAALASLRKQENIRLIEHVLNTENFGQELAACDIILIPYDSSFYGEATSGIFVMGVVARSVVVVTEGNWMARQAQRHALGRVVLMPNNPTAAQMETAMRAAFEKRQQHDMPGPAEKAWCESQTAEGLWRSLKLASG
jgi:hypothetical protein